MKTPLWFKIIKTPYRVQFPSLAFVFGANQGPDKKEHSPGHWRILFDQFLVSLRDEMPENQIASIWKCREIGQPVIAVLWAGYLVEQGIFSEEQKRITIKIDENYSKAKSIEALSEMLWDDLSSSICSGKFSYKNEYCAFNQDEIKHIRSLKPL